MSDRLTAAHVVETDDPERPFRLQMSGSARAVFDLTLVQLWELNDDIAAHLCRHPAPQLPARGCR